METPAGLCEKGTAHCGKPPTNQLNYQAEWGLEERAADPGGKTLGPLHRSGSS